MFYRFIFQTYGCSRRRTFLLSYIEKECPAANFDSLRDILLGYFIAVMKAT